MTKPTKKKTSHYWSDQFKAILQQGFRDKRLSPDAYAGKDINAEIRKHADIFTALLLFFAESEGGTKSINNQLYMHYQTEAGEFITYQAAKFRMCGGFAVRPVI